MVETLGRASLGNKGNCQEVRVADKGEGQGGGSVVGRTNLQCSTSNLETLRSAQPESSSHRETTLRPSFQQATFCLHFMDNYVFSVSGH